MDAARDPAAGQRNGRHPTLRLDRGKSLDQRLGDGLEDAARYACVAAALATTRRGAQPSYPDADEVRARLVRETGA